MDTGTLRVPGADIYYEVRGSGPVLLLINGGDADAGMFGPLAGSLAERYTVLTYDRRGGSRSPLTGPAGEQQVSVHADDAHMLLDTNAGEPAYVFGTSYGAMIGMDLVARHPAQVRALVAHEPFAVELLPDAGRWHAVFQEVYEVYRRDGLERAVAKLSSEAGVAGPPPGPPADLPEPVREMLARVWVNLGNCVAYELRSFTRFRPDLDALRGASFVPAGGADSHETPAYRIASVLAYRLGTQIVDFPGDHGGYLFHPAEFAETLHTVLGVSPARYFRT